MTDARELTLSLGGTWRHGHGNAPCPVCQPERRKDQTALSISQSGERLLAFCHKSRCSFADIAMAMGLPSSSLRIDEAAIAEAERHRSEYYTLQINRARELWERAKPIAGTKGEAYFRGRGITVPLPESLRFMSDICHPSSCAWVSAIVADVQPTGGVPSDLLTCFG